MSLLTCMLKVLKESKMSHQMPEAVEKVVYEGPGDDELGCGDSCWSEAHTLDLITSGRIPKGDVLATARVAGIQAAKRTGEWIPLAHPLPLDSVEVELTPEPPRGILRVQARVETHWKTGVEMEALVAASASALTIYDMCKAVDRAMSVQNLRLSEKTGGKSGHFLREGEEESPMHGREAE